VHIHLCDVVFHHRYYYDTIRMETVVMFLYPRDARTIREISEVLGESPRMHANHRVTPPGALGVDGWV